LFANKYSTNKQIKGEQKMITKEAKDKITNLIKGYKKSLEKRKIPNKKFIVYSNANINDDFDIVHFLYTTGIKNFDAIVLPLNDQNFLQGHDFGNLVAGLRHIQYASIHDLINGIELDKNDNNLKDNYVNFINVIINGDRTRVEAKNVKIEVYMDYFNTDECELIAEDYDEIYNGNLRDFSDWLEVVQQDSAERDFSFWHDLEQDIVSEVKYYEVIRGIL